MITLERTDFIKALQLVSPIVKAASDIAALKSVRITANGEFAIEANDLDRSMRCKIAYSGQPAEFMLPTPAKLATAIRYAGDEQIRLHKDDDAEAGVCIEAGQLQANLRPTIAPGDFPGVDLVGEEEWGADIGERELAQLARLLTAISVEETRYYLNGVMLSHVGDWTWRGHATDGHRLYIVDIPLPGATGHLPDGIIIPRQFLKGMLADFARTKNPVRLSYGMKPLPNDRTDVTLPVHPRGRIFQASGLLGNVHCAVSTKLIDGHYPDVMRVMPSEVATTATVDKAALLAAMRSVCAMSTEKTRAIRFDLAEDALTLSLNSPEVGQSAYRIKASVHGLQPGPLSTIGFNGRYLFDLCSALSGAEVTIGISGNGLPATFTDPADPTFKAVLMPVRI